MIKRCIKCSRIRRLAGRGLCGTCYQRLRKTGGLEAYPIQGPTPPPFTYKAIAERLGISVETLEAHRKAGRIEIDHDGTVLRWDGLRTPTGGHTANAPCEVCGRPVASRARGVCRRCEAERLFAGVVFDGVRYRRAG